LFFEDIFVKMDQFTQIENQNGPQLIPHIVEYISPAKTRNFAIFVCFCKLFFCK